MANKPFQHNVQLVPLCIPNDEQDRFRDALCAIPYLFYEVEQLSDGTKIVINKPGGKRSFGRLSHNDIMVFIYNPADGTLWLISHREIKEDLLAKRVFDETAAVNLVSALYAVCGGDDPRAVIKTFDLHDTIGLPVETILLVYKWIWGQEDCNYPKQQGRWMSMNGILEAFRLTVKDVTR